MSADNETSTRRFWVEAIPPAGQIVALGPDEAHHAAHVLRVRQAQPVELFDGEGTVALATIEQVKRGDVRLRIESLRRCAREGLVVHLGFATPKGKRLDWLLEKATELGCASLTPVKLSRSVAGADELSAHQLARWRAHCVGAAKQSRQNLLPRISQPAGLEEYLRFSQGRRLLLGDAGVGSMDISAALATRLDHQQIVILVGPEGGFTNEEICACESAGALRVRICRSILRIETAAIAILAAIMATDS